MGPSSWQSIWRLPHCGHETICRLPSFLNSGNFFFLQLIFIGSWVVFDNCFERRWAQRLHTWLWSRNNWGITSRSPTGRGRCSDCAIYPGRCSERIHQYSWLWDSIHQWICRQSAPFCLQSALQSSYLSSHDYYLRGHAKRGHMRKCQRGSRNLRFFTTHRKLA